MLPGGWCAPGWGVLPGGGVLPCGGCAARWGCAPGWGVLHHPPKFFLIFFAFFLLFCFFFFLSLGIHPPSPTKQTQAYGQRAAGTHPTGMHSCCQVRILSFTVMESIHDDKKKSSLSSSTSPSANEP